MGRCSFRKNNELEGKNREKSLCLFGTSKLKIQAFASAQKKFTDSASSLFTDRVVGFGTYDINKPNGATHWSLVTGKDVNDHLGLISEVQENKAFKVYIQSRGEVEQIHDFVVEVLKRYQ